MLAIIALSLSYTDVLAKEAFSTAADQDLLGLRPASCQMSSVEVSQCTCRKILAQKASCPGA